MKKLILFLLMFPCLVQAQIGIKAGLNFANVTNAASINSNSRTGYHFGLLVAPQLESILSSRTELLFSRQGYDYRNNTNTGNVNLDYLMLPQYLSINLPPLLSVHVGGHISYLLNAKADNKNSGSGTGISYDDILGVFNRFDFGLGGGVELHPPGGLLIGARVNFSLSKLYDPDSYSSGNSPVFIPKDEVKNNVFQIYAGWRFGQ